MVQKCRPISKRVVAFMMLSYAYVTPISAQFVPGHVYVTKHSNNHCETDCFGIPFDEEYIWELNPETQKVRLFATIPRELCGGINGMAFSPDGKKLRVASRYLSVIFEFDSEGNRSIVLDYWDGIVGPAGCSSIAYDPAGNFYVANYGANNVLKFPLGGGPAEVIAEYDENSPVLVAATHTLAVANDGTTYVATLTTDPQILRIENTGQLSVLDTFTEINASVSSIAVDDLGNVFVNWEDIANRYIYRYLRDLPDNRETYLTCLHKDPLICGVRPLSMSEDQSYIIGRDFNELVYINPVNGTVEPGPTFPLGNVSNCGTAVVPLRADVNKDGIADLADYSLLESCLFGPDVNLVDLDCDGVDLDADGDVDIFDLRFFQRAFGGSR